MEENKVLSELGGVGMPSSPTISVSPDPTGLEQQGEDIPNLSIVKLEKTLKSVENIFNEEKRQIENKLSIFLWVAIGIAIMLFTSYCFALGRKDWIAPDFDCKNNLKVSYEIGLRIVFVSLFISVIVYCLKMVRLYLSILEQARHKIAVLKSLPTLVHAPNEGRLFNDAYIKIIDMLVKSGGTGIVEKEDGGGLAEIVKVIQALRTVH